MDLNDATVLRDLLRQRLAHTSESSPRPIAVRDLPVSLEQLLGEDYEHDLRAAGVLVPIMDRPSGLTVLLTRRSEDLRAHAGQISFPGGSREQADQSLAETALREAREEVGLDPDLVSVLGYLDDYPTVSRFLITPVVGLVSSRASVQPDGVEVAEVFEVPLSHVLDANRYRQDTIERAGHKLPFYTLEHEHYRIWGATAGMLLNLKIKILGDRKVTAAE